MFCQRVTILLFLGLFLFENSAFSQRFPGGGLSGNRGGAPSPNSHLVKDTSEIYYFFADSPNTIIPFSDSLLESIHQFDPLRQKGLNYANLGNLGSAAFSLFYEPAFRRGFDAGLHQFDMYQLQTADVRYYKVTQAFTQASFSQGATQNDALFQLRFSRNFADGLNLSIEQRSINNAGAYDFQKALNTSVGVGLWYHNKGNWYDGYFSFVSNAIQQENNGGIAEALSDTIIPSFQIDVHLRTPMTRHANKEFAYTQYLYLNKWKERPPKIKEPKPNTKGKDTLNLVRPLGKVDTVLFRDTARVLAKPAPSPASAPREFKRSYTLYHQIAWRTESFKFYDTKPDTSYYGDFLVDGRGLRMFLEANKIENTFKVQTFKLRQRSGIAVESDLLEIGLVHSLHFIMQEPLESRTQNNLFLTGRLNFSPGTGMRLETYGHLGLGSNAGDFRMQGTLFLDFKKAGSLKLEAINQLYSPSLLYERFFLSSKEIWNHNFGKTLETSLAGTYMLPALKFSATGRYQLVSNLVYFDSLARPNQSDAFSVLQLIFRKDINAGNFTLENWVGLQQSTSDVLRLPQVFTKHSLYFQKKIFKKVMLAKIGLDARVSSGYKAPSYHPLIGQFYNQNTTDLPFTPLLDAFLSFQVKTFRFFYKIENVLPSLTKEYYYQVAGYPQPFGTNNGGSRFGISWRLVD